MKRKVISMAVAFTMFLSMFSITVCAETHELNGGELLKQQVLNNKIVQEKIELKEPSLQDDAVLDVEYLQRYVDDNEDVKKVYGGCYIDDNKKLHVLFTEDVDENEINNINKTISSDIVYETSRYTIYELNALQENVVNYISKETADLVLKELIEDIVGVGISQERNTVFVEIKNCNEKKIDIFKKMISNSSAITFENVVKVEYVYALNPGQGISIGSSTSNAGTYSIGFRCYRLLSTGGYIEGFVTAAHNNAVGENVYVSNKNIGTIAAWERTNNGTVDAAFVRITDDEYVSVHTTHNKNNVLVPGSYVGSFSSGETVKKEGSGTGYTSGKIKSASYTLNGTVTTRDCVSATYNCAPGDSGGIVYQTIDSLNYVAGICMASVTKTNTSTGEETKFSVFVKATNIRTALSLALY